MYRIRKVDGQDEDIADVLAEIHRLTFFDTATIPSFEHGHWWLAYRGNLPVGCAGVIASTHAHHAGDLQLRFMRAMETQVRRNGWTSVISDTTDNLASANNFIRAGYRLYQPRDPWAWPHTLYWRKLVG